MTICVYKNGVLASDSRCTLYGEYALTDSYKKLGFIYECQITGERSLYQDNLQAPSYFAMYSFAGDAAATNKFLRWFINVDHPVIDCESSPSFDEDAITTFNPEETELQIIIVFKNKNIVRFYNSNYENHVYIDFKKTDFLTIGSGSIVALGIHTYDSSASAEDILKATIKVVNSCGGEIWTQSFDTADPLPVNTTNLPADSYEKEENFLTKIGKIFNKK